MLKLSNDFVAKAERSINGYLGLVPKVFSKDGSHITVLILISPTGDHVVQLPSEDIVAMFGALEALRLSIAQNAYASLLIGEQILEGRKILTIQVERAGHKEFERVSWEILGSGGEGIKSRLGEKICSMVAIDQDDYTSVLNRGRN